jgi:hypothetical protein
MPDHPYAIRLTGSPYNPFLPDCKSLKVMAHNRGMKLSPYVVKQVLEKFGIPEIEFLAAWSTVTPLRADARTGTQLPIQ